MKIYLAQQNYHIGNFEANTQKILTAIQEARAGGGDLIVFPELSICGYPPRDFLEFEDFIAQCEAALERICEAADGIAVLVGGPTRNPRPEGKDLFNAAFFLHEKSIKSVVHKTLLPTYDIFDEYRYFEPAFDWQVIPFKGHRLAVTICEDIWNLDADPLYRFNPMDKLMAQAPSLMINLSASPFDYVHGEERREVVRENVLHYGLPMLYCNAVGAQTEIIFDGGSMAMNAQGESMLELPYFQEAWGCLELNADGKPNQLPLPQKQPRLDAVEIPQHFEEARNIALIHEALLLGIRDYFGKMGFREAIVASSGGIDSAVVLALACKALGAGHVRALLMPSPFSSAHSVEDAVQLSKNLGNPYDIVPIAPAYEALLASLKPQFGDLPFSLAEENLQSRIRGNLVMAMANKFGYILLNTSNKSELSTGYGTLYGDMAGGLGVLGDLYKRQVYQLAAFINREQEIIPRNILEKAPSAELRPGQKDSDSLPDYSVMDPILYQYIERRQGPKEISAMGFDASLVARILRMVNINEYKRAQFCPIIRVSPKAFGVGRRVPIVGKYLS
ncbi:MAG: NAD+ synthase [Bacteroidetes bacterium]|nr:NAD+ synthase [Bacteroidota bacterium]MBS1628790.1 NAD+ synthase [Bacteroidota bacterium]